ncbi:MAG: [Fe-Fe] hydrogenase large subunit C-terminal domain-containing protein [candidate division KSB1 bacterium]|nr:[Fe-Fe] hydrogenase large subunit C-terminal domain-containing protein [candidate division KSB1 bacterium]
MAVVWTIEEKCRRCYSCVRECPAKAIKVEHGQAKVIENRCLGCGHCVNVCSQGAKEVLNGTREVMHYLKSDSVIAMLAPSFPAVYPDLDTQQLVGALRACGFDKVVEVAFGADLVNKAYLHLLKAPDDPDIETMLPVIASSCPAIFSYVQKYIPELVPHIARIVSPMVAMGRAVNYLYGQDKRVVFIGPCTAKKVEIQDEQVSDSVDMVLTFAELNDLFQYYQIDFDAVAPRPLDPPHAYLGRLYPVSGGFLRSAGLPTDLMNDDIVLTEGKNRVLNLLDLVKKKEIDAKLIDVLFCEGCISGPFSNKSENYFDSKRNIVRYTENRRNQADYPAWRETIEDCLSHVNLYRSFKAESVNNPEPTEEEISEILARIDKHEKSDELNCGACGYSSCREHAVAVYQGLAEADMCLPFLIDKMEHMKNKLQASLDKLATTQEQLIQHEKLASIGQLAAGVAHEVNNPLGSILLYAHLVKQRMDQAEDDAKDLSFIIEEAKRCQNIVSGLLDFSRQGQLTLKQNHVPDIILKMIEVVKEQPEFKHVRIHTEFADDLPEIYVDEDQLYQVFLNITMNAAEAMPEGGDLTIKAFLDDDTNKMRITFTDTGVGISKDNQSKVFTPFFTTKQIGKGTGLGLAIAYGILKMHKGNIRVKSEVDKGSTFIVDIPLASNQTITKKEQDD